MTVAVQGFKIVAIGDAYCSRYNKGGIGGKASWRFPLMTTDEDYKQ